jgi:hypothetical protein
LLGSERNLRLAIEYLTNTRQDGSKLHPERVLQGGRSSHQGFGFPYGRLPALDSIAKFD